jgi:hypothetical protein
LPTHFVGQVLIFGMTETPYFIALNPMAIQVMKDVVLEVQAGLAQFVGQL